MFTELEALGFHGAVLLGGFSGGLCYVALQERPSIWGACSGIIVATLTANYMSELVAHYIGAGTLLGPAAFVTGLTSTWICKAFIRRARSWNFETRANSDGQSS